MIQHCGCWNYRNLNGKTRKTHVLLKKQIASDIIFKFKSWEYHLMVLLYSVISVRLEDNIYSNVVKHFLSEIFTVRVFLLHLFMNMKALKKH